MTEEPALVVQARKRAIRAEFSLSSEPDVGRLLAVLAAGTPVGGRILEFGTGVGVGLAWIVYGLRDRTDVTVVTVDTNAELLATTREAGWPDYVEFVLRDGADVVQQGGHFDLIFADAVGGKTRALDATINALAPRGVLVVDDMDPDLHQTDGLLETLDAVRVQIITHRALEAAELDFSSGLIIATKTS